MEASEWIALIAVATTGAVGVSGSIVGLLGLRNADRARRDERRRTRGEIAAGVIGEVSNLLEKANIENFAMPTAKEVERELWLQTESWTHMRPRVLAMARVHPDRTVRDSIGEADKKVDRSLKVSHTWLQVKYLEDGEPTRSYSAVQAERDAALEAVDRWAEALRAYDEE